MRRLIPKSRTGTFVRFTLACVVVIAFAATATAVAGLLQFKQIATYISATPALPTKSTQVTIPSPGDPQTLLLIGSDHRAGTPFTSAQHRHDDARPYRSELEHDQPPVGPARPRGPDPRGRRDGDRQAELRLLDRRRRACWSGSSSRRCSPASRSTTSSTSTSAGSIDLVNAIGCVYADVDHRYYNNTAPDGLLEHRHPARLPEAVRHRCARVRALPPHRHATSSATRASRTSCAGRRASSARTRSSTGRGHAAEDLRPARADRREPAHHRRADQPVRPGRVLRRPRDQADPVPGDPAPVRAGGGQPPTARPSRLRATSAPTRAPRRRRTRLS